MAKKQFLDINGLSEFLQGIKDLISSAVKVTGVKGESETQYRTGNINITKSNIGLGNVNNTADATKNVASAAKLTTAKTFKITGDVSGTVTSDLSNGATINTTISSVPWDKITDQPETFTPSVHTHTKSQITDFPTSLKNPTSITLQLNSGTTEGTNKFTYDGSAAKTLNITASGIGAATSGHTHNAASTSSNGFMSSTDKSKLDNIDDNANNYVHPTTSGNKHIPSGGSSGQILRWSSDGTAVWGNDNNTTYNNFTGATSTANGKSGLVPAPSTGDNSNKYLKADGTWSVPPDTKYTLSSFGVTATASEINKLDGCTATVTELNYLDGVTSNIQTQLNNKASTSQNMYIGTTKIPINRESSALTLTGVSIDGNSKGVVSKQSISDFNTLVPTNNAGQLSTFTSSSSATGRPSLGGSQTGGIIITPYSNYHKILAFPADAGTSAPMAIKEVDANTANSEWRYFALGNSSGKAISASSADSATKATSDSLNQNIADTYIKALSVNGKTITYTKGDGGTGTITTQDTNTTYSQATSTTLGLVKTGYTENGKNYPVELSNGQMFVNVPWTDTNTTYGVATSSALGLIKSGNDITIDSSGNVSVVGGDVNTAQTLKTARTINGVSFNGSSNITIKANPQENSLTNQDLNDIKTSGEYYAGGSNTVTNKPSGIDAFSLQVFRSAGGYYTQILVGGNNSTNKMFIRTYTSESWTSWQSFYSTEYPQTSVSGNAGTATKWATARNINGLSIQGDANRVNYGVCSTAAATAAKVVSCSGFALITGSEITVKFTVTNTASSPTLNVNSTGAKAIYYRGSAISAGYLGANRTYTFRYNGTQYELVGDINTDTNTTYSTGTSSVSGITKLYTGTGSATDGTMTQAAITNALNGKASSSHTHNWSSITNKPTNITTTIPLSGWSDTAPYTCAVTVSGMTENGLPDVLLANPTTQDEENDKIRKKSFGYISHYETSSNKITFTCKYNKPTINLPILIKGVS